MGEARTGRGHEVVTVGRTAGDLQADVADPEQTARVFAEVGDLDAVASAAGDVPYKRIADMTVELMASRALVHRCAARRQTGTETPADLAAAKLYSTEAAARAAEQAVMPHGGRGYSSEYPAERLPRDIQGLRIYEGTTMIQKGILARSVLR